MLKYYNVIILNKYYVLKFKKKSTKKSNYLLNFFFIFGLTFFL